MGGGSGVPEGSGEAESGGQGDPEEIRGCPEVIRGVCGGSGSLWGRRGSFGLEVPEDGGEGVLRGIGVPERGRSGPERGSGGP